MNFDLDENQTLFRDTVERFCAPVDVATRHKMRKLTGGFDKARWREMAELGVIGLAAGEADGGLGGSLLDCAIVAQALGKGMAIEPWLECGYLSARLLAGSVYAAGMVSGETLAAFAFAEPNRRFQLDALSVEAKGGKLNGEKRFVLGGAAADQFIVSASHNGGTKLFVVAADAPGVDVKPYPIADGSFAAVLTLRDAAHGDPLSVDFEKAVDDTRLMAAAEMVGLAQRLFDETVTYVKTREQFGQPIGRFQVIQHRLVDCYAKVEQIQSALYRALLQPGSVPQAVKAFIADEAIWVGQQAVQLHGGMGMTDELAIGHALKRMLLLSKLFGDVAGGIAHYAKAA
jgi:alkylation response protein AidB-like acyl-CoA dehydrogenase